MRNMISSSPLWARWLLFLDAARSSNHRTWIVGILFLRKSAKGGIMIGIRLSVCIWTYGLHETHTSCYGLSPSSESQGELTMADAIIFRRRGSGGGGAEYTPPNISGGTQSNTGNWWTAIFTNNGWFKAGQAKSNQYTVMCFGGGGPGQNTYYGMLMGGPFAYKNYGCCGGGGGCMNKTTLTLTPNTNIAVTVGAGGSRWTGSSYPDYIQGGTSSFGTYISAQGGNGAYIRCFDTGYHCDGGNGGSGGGTWIWNPQEAY